MKRVREESGVVSGKRTRPIPVITISPDSSPVEQTTREEQLPIPKRTREYVQFIPPIPDAVELTKVDVVNVRLNSQLLFQVQPACVCPRPPLPNNIQIICRCMQAPFPHVRLMSTARQFELLDTKWAVHLHELTPTTVVNPHMQTKLNIYPLENELFNETEIDITAQVTLITSTTGGDEIKRQVFELGNHRFRRGSQYLFPINKSMLDRLLNQPIGSPGSAYPSTVNLTAQIQLLVTNYKCLNRDPRFTLDFTKEKSLSNFVIKCGRKSLFVDCKYLRHYSEYFNVLSNLSDDMDRGLVMRDQESGLPCVSMDESDFDAWNALLLYCSPCHNPVPNRLLIDVIRISDAYQFVTVKKETELLIIRLLKSNEGKDYSDLQLLVTAEDYNLVHLKEHALNSLFRNSAPPYAHFIHTVQTDPLYSGLSETIKSMLMDRLHSRQLNIFQCIPPGFSGPPGSQ